VKNTEHYFSFTEASEEKNDRSVCFTETCSLKSISQIHKLEPRIRSADWLIFFQDSSNQKGASAVFSRLSCASPAALRM